nr:hypothetical protein [Spirochaetales bacterium]
EELRLDFLKRYHFLPADEIHTITNGFEQLDSPAKVPDRPVFTIVHVGELYMSRNPLNLLQALNNLLEKGKVLPEKVSVEFVGGLSIDDVRLHDLMKAPLLADVVKVLSRVTHEEALQLQQHATVLLLIQPGFHLQIPRKLYEYISFRKPVLAIADDNGATSNLIRNKRLGTVVTNDTAAIEEALLVMYISWESKTLKGVAAEDLHEFDNSILSDRLSHVLNEACREHL